MNNGSKYHVLNILGERRNAITHFGVDGTGNLGELIICILNTFDIIYNYLYPRLIKSDAISEYFISDDLVVDTIHGQKPLFDYDYIPQNKTCTTKYALECCFHKSSRYQYQHEFRIAVINESKKCSIDDVFVDVAKDDLFILPIEINKNFIVETTISENHNISEQVCLLGTDNTFYFED